MKKMKYIGAGSGEQRVKREERRAESKREQELRFVTADCNLHGLPALLTQKEKTGNIEHRITNIESGRNIPVRCTFGFNRISSAANIDGAAHLRFAISDTAINEIFTTSGTAINEKAAAPQNICSFGYRPSGTKVHSTEILNRNDEHRITNIESGRNIAVRCTFGFNRISSATKVIGATHLSLAANPDGAHSAISGCTAIAPSYRIVIHTDENDIPTISPTPLEEVTCRQAGMVETFLPPSPSGEGWGEVSLPPPLWGGREGRPPRLPRGGFNSGDFPGAAAITRGTMFNWQFPGISRQ